MLQCFYCSLCLCSNHLQSWDSRLNIFLTNVWKEMLDLFWILLMYAMANQFLMYQLKNHTGLMNSHVLKFEWHINEWNICWGAICPFTPCSRHPTRSIVFWKLLGASQRSIWDLNLLCWLLGSQLPSGICHLSNSWSSPFDKIH